MAPLVIPVVNGLFDIAKNIFSRVFPDPVQQADAQLKFLTLQQAGEFKELDAALQIAQGQMDTNKVEAASDSLFKSGWRPAVGWVCVAALGFQYLARPLLPWFATVMGFHVPDLPGLDDNLWQLLMGMLGLGTLRTVEKLKAPK